MRKLRPHYTIHFMCRMLNISPSGYHTWLTRLPSQWAKEEARLEIEIKAAHERTAVPVDLKGCKRTLQRMVLRLVSAGSDGSGNDIRGHFVIPFVMLHVSGHKQKHAFRKTPGFHVH
jgi:hypothetical protein